MKWHGDTLSTYKNHQSNLTGGHASSDHGVQDNSSSNHFCVFKYFCIAIVMCDLVHNVEKLFHIFTFDNNWNRFLNYE